MDKIPFNPENSGMWSIIPDMEKERRKVVNIDMFTTGICSIVFGLFSPIYSPLFLAIGGGTIVLHFIDKLDGEWDKVFKHCGLIKNDCIPKLDTKRKREYGYDLMFSLPIGMTSKDFEDKKLAIEQYLNAKIEIEYVNKHILMRVKDKQLEHFYEYEFVETNSPLEILIGIDENTQKPITIRLDDMYPHLLIGGQTGGGKTVEFLNIMVNLINNNKANKIQINLIDLKGVDYRNLLKLKLDHFNEYVDNLYEGDTLISKLTREMWARLNILKEHDCDHIDEYNKIAKRKLKYIFTFIDESSDITLQKNKELKIRMLSNLTLLLQKARCVGIHLIIGLQRPDKDALPGELKANIPLKIGFKTTNAVNSRIIIDSDSAAKLRGKGHGVLVSDKETQFQGMYIDKKNVKKYINCLNKEVDKDVN